MSRWRDYSLSIRVSVNKYQTLVPVEDGVVLLLIALGLIVYHVGCILLYSLKMNFNVSTNYGL